MPCTETVCGTGGWTGPLPGDPDNNSILTATPAYGGIDVSWTYPTLNPHAVIHTLLYRGITPQFELAIQHAVCAGDFYYDKIPKAEIQEYFYWIVIVSVNATPGEPIGPASAVPLASIAEIIQDLTGLIDAGVLAESLRTEIERISSVDNNLSQEIQDRVNEQLLLEDSLAYLTTEIGQLMSQLLQEVLQRTDGENAVLDSLSETNQALQDEIAVRLQAINDERTAWTLALAQEATARGAAITAESTIRQTAEESLADQIDTLTASVGTSAAAVQTQITALTTADSAMASKVDVMIATTDALRATTAAMVLSETTVRATQNEVMAQQINTLSVGMGNNTAAIQEESTVRATAVDALSERITLVSAGIGEQFDFKQIWYFDTTVEGWTGNGTPTNVSGWLRPADHATAAYVDSPTGLAITGSQYSQMKFRVKKTGTPTWAGVVWWKLVGDATWDVVRSAAITAPSFDASGVGDGSASITWPGTVDQVRIVLSAAQTATNAFSLDWVAIGRPSPGASTASLLTEASARASADSALTTTLTTLQSTVTNNQTSLNAAITSEATTRSSADSALASQVTSVSATANGKAKVFIQAGTPAATQLNDLWIKTSEQNKLYSWNGSAWIAADDTRIAQNAAAVVTETSARVDADAALAQELSILTATVGDNEEAATASILGEATTRATNDGALSVRLDVVSAIADTVRSATAALAIGEVVTRASQNEALVTSLSVLSAKVTTDTAANQALVTAEATARATQDTALGNSIASVLATTNTNSAAIQTETTARTTADTALSNQITTLESRMEDDLYAAIQTEQTTRTAADAALATQITTAQSSMAGNLASVQTTLQTNINAVDGEVTNLGALYTAKVNVNGLIGGFGVYNDGQAVEAGFDVDNFWIGKDTQKTKPFIVSGGVTYINNAAIQDGAITNAKIGNTIQSIDFTSGATGWKIDKTGKMEMNNAVFRGNLQIKSAASGARTEMTNDVIKVFDANGVLRVKLGNLA